MAESEYQSEKDWMLPKMKLKSLIERLRKADQTKLQDLGDRIGISSKTLSRKTRILASVC